jgi:hypothetical protein
MTPLSVIPLLLASLAKAQSPIDLALTRTHSLDLEHARPPAVTAAAKAAALASLPKEGEITKLEPLARRKLASLEPVLGLQQRQSVYAVKVIAVPQAYVGLHARAVVLISEPALNLLDGEELQAQVAHEIGHEYVWEQFETAKQRGDDRALQEMELFCDAVALLTLRAASVDPFRLITGLEKMVRFNRQRLGMARNEDSYPSLSDRKRFARLVLTRAGMSNRD